MCARSELFFFFKGLIELPTSHKIHHRFSPPLEFFLHHNKTLIYCGHFEPLKKNQAAEEKKKTKCFVQVRILYFFIITLLTTTVSGEPIEQGVVNSKTGRVYEKKLIETHIKEKGTDPITNQECSIEDLIDLKLDDNTVRPRPNSLTSIPSLLGALQTEWDSMVLEMFQLRQQLNNSKKELSSALYHHDAAVRVCARLTQERDEARRALADLSASVGQPNSNSNRNSNNISARPPQQQQTVEKEQNNNEDTEMNEASNTTNVIPDKVVEQIKTRAEQLKPTRKKRTPDANLATPDDIQNYNEQLKTKQLFTTVSNNSLDVQGGKVLAGGGKSQAGVFSIEENKLIFNIKLTGNITSACFTNYGYAFGLKNGKVELYNSESDNKLELESHDSKVHTILNLPVDNWVISASETLICLHDNESILASYNTDNCYSIAIHPDGELIAIGTADKIEMLNLTTGQIIHTFNHGEQVDTISINENGYSMAVSGVNSNSIYIYHLGKQTITQQLEVENGSSKLLFDYSGQFLCSTNSKNINAWWYNKPKKSWELQLTLPSSGSCGVYWDDNAKQLVSITSKGSIHVFSNNN